MTVEQALQRARAHQKAGQLPQAEALCRQILGALPRQPDALYLLGVIALQTRHVNDALDLISQAIAIQAANPAFYLSLGEVYQALGQDDDAAASFGRALKLDPGCAPAHFLLGALHQRHCRMDKASASYRKALALDPNYAQAHSNLGVVLYDQGKPGEAIACYECALAINPAFAQAHLNLGAALYKEGRLGEAIASYERALAINPDFAQAHIDMGVVQIAQEQIEAAIACFQKAVDIQPDHGDAWNSLGAALVAAGRPDEAIPCLQRAIALKPHSAVYRNLGNVFHAQGQVDAALEALCEAARLTPEKPAQLSAVLVLLHLLPGYDTAMLLQEHQQWEEKHGKPRRRFHQPHANTPSPDRRLKIGYVSPYLWNSTVGRFLLPLFENHDHANFEILCYADVPHLDLVQARLHARVDKWRETTAWDEQRLADQIRQDNVDILVDLSLHTDGNRLSVFARKPAPVQVTWLAYCGTSGLKSMDYRLTDPYLDPLGGDDAAYCETSIRLPETYWCYPPPEEAPAVTPLPALADGFVTFGCFNNFNKVNAQVLTLWAKLLRALPNSRLILHARWSSQRERTWTRLAAEGVSPERVSFVDQAPLAEYFANHGQTDIALDPFPWAGGTTSCDALWMGVPVVTLAGRTGIGRGGVSLLSNIGLPELIAHSEDQYVQIATELASDLPRLAQMRATMRTRMLASPLMDGPRFARGIEAAYRLMWRNWCRSR